MTTREKAEQIYRKTNGKEKQMSQRERELEHRIESTDEDSDVLATVDEKMKNRIQLDEIKQHTIEPGLMKLKVSTVAKAENSEKWAVEVEHPIEGTIRMFLDAPTEGWSDENELVKTLNWYGINKDPYHLQLHRVYVKKTGNESPWAHGWELAEPPSYAKPDEPIKVQLKKKWEQLKDARPRRSHIGVYLFLLLGTVAAVSAQHSPMSVPVFAEIGIGIGIFAVVTLLSLIAFDPPEQ